MADLKKLAQGRKAFTNAKEEKPTKNLEESCADEIGEAERTFRQRMEREDKRRKAATDSEFWFAVYFSDREEKERFLRKYGLHKMGDKYLDGRLVDWILERRNTAKDGHRKER